MTQYSKEEKRLYYQQLRARWAKTKEIANEDEIKAIMSERGISFSVRSYVFVSLQLRALGLEGIPYVDTKTYQGWKESGFIVRKGEKSQIDGITWLSVGGKEVEDPEEEEKSKGYVMPKVYHLFHKTQVEEIL